MFCLYQLKEYFSTIHVCIPFLVSFATLADKTGNIYANNAMLITLGSWYCSSQFNANLMVIAIKRVGTFSLKNCDFYSGNAFLSL